MNKIAFVAIRKNGKNFGKPLALDKVMKEFTLEEVTEFESGDAIRFYDNDGEAIDSKEAVNFLQDYADFQTFETCKTKEDFEAFIAKFPESKYVASAREGIEELIFKSASSNSELKQFLIGYPESKFAEEAKGKLPADCLFEMLVVAPQSKKSTKEDIFDALERKKNISVGSQLLDKDSFRGLENQIKKSDFVVAVMDDNHYVELFMLFALSIKHDKKVVPVYPHVDKLKPISNSTLTQELIKAQSDSSDPVFQDVAREMRVDLEEYLAKIKGFTSIKTDQLVKLKYMF